MSNYTKTTDFEAKDSLPTGDSGKIIRGAEFETEFDAISTAIATKADTAGPTFTGTLTFETISDGTIGVTAFVDEDDMSSDSATLVPTQQSVKAYVDSQVTAQDLDFQADTGGALSIDLDSETLTFTGGTGIDTSGSGNAVTFAIDSTVATLTGTQTLTNKTLTSPDVNTPDIDGGTIDGTVIGGTTPAAVSATTVSATGNITVGGTVDGRDVATDGTKLDGIESGATADQTAAEIRTLVESATDSNVFTDADHSKLDGIEASADVTDTANVTAAGALMDSELTSEASVKALNQGVATTDSPTFAGVTVNGTVEFDGLSGTGAVSVTDILDQDDMSSNSATALATQQSIKAYVDSQVATADTLAEVLANGNTTGGTDVAFGDNDKAIFGAGSDLQIYHDGVHSYIADVGTGVLFLRGESNIVLENNSGSNYFEGTSNGASTIYYAGNAKLATTSTGIDVTGVITTDGMTTSADINFGDNDKAIFGAGSDLQIYHDGSNSRVQEAGTGSLLLRGTNLKLQDSDGYDYVACEDLGENGGRVKLRHNNVVVFETTSTGIDVTGTVTADSAKVENSTTSAVTISESTGGGTAELRFVATESFPKTKIVTDVSAGSLSLETVGNERLNIASNGDISFYEDTGTTAKLFWDASAESLGIGTSSPSGPLDVVSSSGAVGQYIRGRSSDNIGSLYFTSNASASTEYGYVQGRSTDLRIQGFNNGLILQPSSGNVGIGNSNPDSLVHAYKASNAILKVEETSGYVSLQQSGVNSYLNNVSSGGSLIFRNGTAPTERMRIDSSGRLLVGLTGASGFGTVETDTLTTTGQCILARTGGNVGIGTSSPSRPLDVLKSGSGGYIAKFRTSANALNVYDAGTAANGIGIGTESGQSLRLFTNDTLASGITVDSSGNVGIGRSVPSAKLDVDLAATGDIAIFRGSSSDTFTIESDGSGILLDTRNTTAGLTFQMQGANKMTLDASGNLLVGKTTSSFATAGTTILPSGNVTFTRSGAGVIDVNRLSNDGSLVNFYKDGTTVGSIGVNTGDKIYIGTGASGVGFSTLGLLPFNTSTNAFSNGSLDLGNGSFRWKDLYLSGTANVGGAYFGTGVEANLIATFAPSTGGNAEFRNTSSTGTFTFTKNNGSSETVRIDSSGNLLVGTTDANPTNNSANSAADRGIAFSGGQGWIANTTYNETTAYFNRTGTDGTIIELIKSGTTVGSIGVSSGDLVIGTGVAGVRFKDSGPSLEPRAANGNGNDGGIDLGMSSSRWRDLYLSGGAYLGGTGSANKLDDYEEGTWAPVYEPETGSFTTMTMDNVSNTYTKIGDTVIAMCYVRTSDVDVTGASGALHLGGLPFTISGYYQVSIGNVFGWTGERPDGGYGFSGQDYVKLRYRSSVTSDSVDSNVSDLTTGTSANRNQIIMTFIYKTSE